MSKEASEEPNRMSERKPLSKRFMKHHLGVVEKYTNKWKKEIRETIKEGIKDILEGNYPNASELLTNLQEDASILLALMNILLIMSTSGIRHLEIEAIMITRAIIRDETMNVMKKEGDK